MNRTPDLQTSPTKSKAPPCIELFLSAFCDVKGYPPHEIVRPGRRPEKTWRRQEFFYYALHVPAYSYAFIAQSFGIEHSTVYHGALAYAARNGLPPVRDKRSYNAKRSSTAYDGRSYWEIIHRRTQ